MRASNPPYPEESRRHPSPHLTPIEKEPAPAPVEQKQQQLSDRLLLRRFQVFYRRTGRCESLSQLEEVARLAHQGTLISPKRARSLFRDLDKIEADLQYLLVNLSARVTMLGDAIRDRQVPSPEERFDLTRNLGQTVELLVWLMAIARNHPDPPEPGVEEGVAPCYLDLLKRTNDLRYTLAYLHEHLRPQYLGQQLARHPHPDLQLVALSEAINDLYHTAMAIVPRLRENIARYVPQLWGSRME